MKLDALLPILFVIYEDIYMYMYYHSFYSLCVIRGFNEEKQLFSLEQLEYDVYKSENDTKNRKIMTLDNHFNITISSNK